MSSQPFREMMDVGPGGAARGARLRRERGEGVLAERAAAIAPRAPPGGEILGRLRALYLRSEALRGYLLLTPTLLVVAATMCVPIGLAVAYSFWTQDYLTIDRTFTLANYEQLAEREIYRGARRSATGPSG